MTDGGTSIPEVRTLLSVLAAGRKAAEAGTAFGEGSKAIAETASSLVTVEVDPERAALAATALAGFENVESVLGDWHEVLPPRGPFEFLFLDSTFKNDPHGDGGLAVDLLVPGALLLIDDMTPEWKGHDDVRESLFQNPLLRSVEVLTTRETSAIISARR